MFPDYGWQILKREKSPVLLVTKSVRGYPIRLTGEMANRYDVYYRAHVQDKGWLGWACNDPVPERLGLALRLEAYQGRFWLKKGSPAPGDTVSPIQKTFSIKAHVSNLGLAGTCL